MRFVAAHGMPLIRHFQAAAEVTLNAELRRAMEAEIVNIDLVRALMEEARAVHVKLDAATLEFALRRKLETMAEEWESQPCDLEKVSSLEAAVKLARSFPFEVRLWEIQNAYYSVLVASANGNKARWAGCDWPGVESNFPVLGGAIGNADLLIHAPSLALLIGFNLTLTFASTMRKNSCPICTPSVSPTSTPRLVSAPAKEVSTVMTSPTPRG